LRRTADGRRAGPAISWRIIWLDVCQKTPAKPWITSSVIAPPIVSESVKKK
jgi:hypothetical protein